MQKLISFSEVFCNLLNFYIQEFNHLESNTRRRSKSLFFSFFRIEIMIKLEEGENKGIFIYQTGCSLVNTEQVIWKNKEEKKNGI